MTALLVCAAGAKAAAEPMMAAKMMHFILLNELECGKMERGREMLKAEIGDFCVCPSPQTASKVRWRIQKQPHTPK